MIFRHATMNDLSQIESIYEQARQFMRKVGNHQQWSNAYPDQKTIIKDIQANHLYVGIEGGTIVGVFALIPGEDPTYQKIDGGQWLNDAPYATIHRIASSGIIKRFSDTVFNWAFEQYDNIRIDTHEVNLPMRESLVRNGFTYCGIIYLTNGDPRLAFQKAKN